MFLHHCTACDRRQLVFPDQVTSLVNLDSGILVGLTCWCGAEQVHVTGKKITERREAALAA